jgi:hypothetical protein
MRDIHGFILARAVRIMSMLGKFIILHRILKIAWKRLLPLKKTQRQ